MSEEIEDKKEEKKEITPTSIPSGDNTGEQSNQEVKIESSKSEFVFGQKKEECRSRFSATELRLFDELIDQENG